MIKLILTDLDGTLLHDDKTYSHEELEKLVDELAGKDIMFGFASGRPVSSLKKSFGDILDKITVICANGCILMLRGEIIHMAELTEDDVQYLMSAFSRVDNIEILMDGIQQVFYSSDNPGLLALMDKYRFPRTKLESLYEAFQLDKIYKIALYDGIDPLTHGIPALQSITDRFLVIPSGDEWLDIVKKGEDKGNCVKRLQKLLGITPDQTMCFGDYYNDIPLFENCVESWVMKNAPDEIKQYARHITKYDNNEDGVIRTIREFVL